MRPLDRQQSLFNVMYPALTQNPIPRTSQSGQSGQSAQAEQSGHALRSDNEPSLLQTKGNAGIVSPVQMNYLKAVNRLNNLFSLKNFSQIRQSSRAPDFYMDRNFPGGVPQGARNIMIFLDDVCKDVHRTIAHGRGNVLLKNKHVLGALGKGMDPDGINRDEVVAKTYLKELGEAILDRLDGDIFDDEDAEEGARDEALQLAACAALTGSSGCEGYASLFAIAAAYRCEKAGLRDVTIDVIDAPKLGRNTVDHLMCRVTVGMPDGTRLKLDFDPWGNVNSLFVPHSPYESGELKCSFSSGESLDEHKDQLFSYLKEGSDLIPEVRDSEEFQENFADVKNHIHSADSRKRYPLDKTHHGFSSIEELDMVRSGVQAMARRPSIISAQKSDLLKA